MEDVGATRFAWGASSLFKQDDIVLLDCLTTWLNNELFFVEDQWQEDLFRADLFERICQGIKAISQRVRTLIIVSNEVFYEPIGDNDLVFHYSQLLGKLHQSIVASAHQAFLVEAGIPVLMKGEDGMKGVMIQGTASDVGKSLIATAFCRLFANEGMKVAPFKSQNMSNNSYVTINGLEIGRAQGIQAEAAKTEATVWMNPILLKPRSDQESEIVLLGKAVQTLSGKGYRETFYEKGLEVIHEALNQLGQEFEVLVLEGAGSPVEMNLKDRELVNMKIAEMADIPVFLVADIDRGGIFASIVGTLELLTSAERKRVQGIIINKFRGDFSLFTDGVKWIEEKTGIPVLGVLPYVNDHMIDREDSLSINEFRRHEKNG